MLITKPCNPNAQEGVKKVMEYLAQISGKSIVTGQHTQDMEQPELKKIVEVTGKRPALLGFELLSYSSNINYYDTDEACLKEVIDNRGTLQKAWEWAKEKGLITFTWHWFSPLYGKSKAFYTENTEFDAEKAAVEGTPEYNALISDIDMMAGILRPFCESRIPVLWRPFHEGEGKWFWWGAKGPEVLIKLYRILYDRFTKVHHLDNLIWVWNSPLKEGYPGDDVVDIISRDLYPEAHSHSDRGEEYEEMISNTTREKIAALAETGVLPDVDMLHKNGTGWTYFMTWSHEFCLSEEYNTFEYMEKLYSSDYAITLENLPELY